LEQEEDVDPYYYFEYPDYGLSVSYSPPWIVTLRLKPYYYDNLIVLSFRGVKMNTVGKSVVYSTTMLVAIWILNSFVTVGSRKMNDKRKTRAVILRRQTAAAAVAWQWTMMLLMWIRDEFLVETKDGMIKEDDNNYDSYYPPHVPCQEHNDDVMIGSTVVVPVRQAWVVW
jgi:hypothetical protein